MNCLSRNSRLFFLAFMIVVSSAAFAQDEILHTVKSGESLSRLAKQYHTTVGEIMRANGMNSKSILKIGKTIKIPSANAAVTEASKKAEPKIAVPKKEIAAVKKSAVKDTDVKIHVVGKKETLYGIGKKYNVTVTQLKSWNDIKGDNIHENQKLIIIPNTNGKPMVDNELAVAEKKPATAVANNVVAEESKPKPVVNKPAEKKAPVVVTPAQETIVSKAPEKSKEKPVQLPATPAEQKPVAVAPAATITETVVTAAPEKPVEKSVQAPVVEEQKPIANTSQRNVLPVITSSGSEEEDVNINLNNISGEGYFAALYHKGKNELTGDAGILKTESGLAEKKYYILINSIDAGTIVRITARGKTVYAKVLGPLPDIKEDNGLLLRISSTALSVLGISDAKFPVKVNY
jgi:LysM repeat protein